MLAFLALLGAPHIYDISSLRVNDLVLFDEVDVNEIFKNSSYEEMQRASIAKTNRLKFQTQKPDCCENETDSIKSFYRKCSELLNVKLDDTNNDD